MPIFVVIVVVLILMLTAWVIIHPSPLFEDTWYLHAWGGPRVAEFTQNLQSVTFALGEDKETLSLVPMMDGVMPLDFHTDGISFTEVNAYTNIGVYPNITNFYLEYSNATGFDVVELKIYEGLAPPVTKEAREAVTPIASLTFMKEEKTT